MKTPDDDRQEIENILIGNIFCGYIQEDRMIDVRKKLFDVALAADTLDAWILGSVAESLDRPIYFYEKFSPAPTDRNRAKG